MCSAVRVGQPNARAARSVRDQIAETASSECNQFILSNIARLRDEHNPSWEAAADRSGPGHVGRDAFRSSWGTGGLRTTAVWRGSRADVLHVWLSLIHI